MNSSGTTPGGINDGGDAWRDTWNELTRRQRADVRAAVRLGRQVDDPTLAPLVAGLVARKMRWHLPYSAVAVVLVGVGGGWALVQEGRPGWWAVLPAVFLAASRAGDLWLARRARNRNTSST